MKLSTDEIKSMRIFSAMTFICALCVWMILSILVNIFFFTEKGHFFFPASTRDAITLMDGSLSKEKPSDAKFQSVIDDWKVLKNSDDFNTNMARFEEIDAMPIGIKIFIPFPFNESIYQEYTAARKQIMAPVKKHLVAEAANESTDKYFMDIHVWTFLASIVFFVVSIAKVLTVRFCLERDLLQDHQKNLAYFTYRITRHSLIGINAFLILGALFFFWLTA